MKNKLIRLLFMLSKFTFIGFVAQFFMISLLLAHEMNAQKIMSVKEKVIEANSGNASIKGAFSMIEEKTNYNFFYDEKIIDKNLKLNLPQRRSTVAEILYEISRQASLRFRQINHTINVNKIEGTLHQENIIEVVIQTRNITGKVTSYEDGEPLPGVNIIEKGTSNGTVTNADGVYSLEVADEAILVFSSVGYTKEEIAIGQRSVVDLVMTTDIQQLQELVVVGYGTQEKKLVTGATTQVKGEAIEKLNTTSPLIALQSQTPGLSIIAESARPDAEYKINIRGLGTIGDAAPLVVINGIVGGDIRSISPYDIESIDILKDAASAAIYGSRAANGVILITTKQGKAGKMNISYDGNYGIQNVYDYLDMVNAQEYMGLINESINNIGGTPVDFNTILPADIQEKLDNGWQGTDWWRELTNKNAPVQNHALNITGGSEQSVYSLGLSYTNQESIIGNPLKEKFNRISFRLNSDHVLLKKNNRNIIKIGENLLYTYKDKQNNLASGWRWAASNPLFPVRDENGGFYKPISFDAERANPVAYQYYHSQNELNSRDFMINAFLEVNPVEGLQFLSNFGSTIIQTDFRRYIPEYNLTPSNVRLQDLTEQQMTINNGIQWMNTLSYDLRLARDHNFKVLLGQSIEKQNMGVQMHGENVGSIFDNYQYAYLDNVKQITLGQTSLGGRPFPEVFLASFFSRINYAFRDKYLLTAIVRRDGSSNFAQGNRWGTFPSVSAGWILTEEQFLRSTAKWLDFLKLRLSWGQNGNQNIDNFQYLTSYSFSNARYSFGADKSLWAIGAYPSILPNPNITWETSEQWNLGIDSRFFDGCLNINAELYQKTTKDWLLRAPILASQGAQAPFVNGGDVENRGLELILGWRESKGDFSYDISGNISFNKNEVTRIDNSEGIIEGNQVNEHAVGQLPPYRAQVGFPIGYFWGYKTAGVFQNQNQIDNYEGPLVGDQPGDLIFVDINNDGTINSEDRTMIGDPNPNALVGLSLSLNYKAFDFSVVGNGVFGNQILISYNRADGYQENYPAYRLNRWHGEGTSNRYPRLTSTPSPNYTYLSDTYIENGDYLRIQNITIGYDLSQLFESNILQKARLFITGQNLITFTNYIGANPEVGYSPSNWGKGIDVNFNPLPKTYLLGVNIQF